MGRLDFNRFLVISRIFVYYICCLLGLPDKMRAAPMEGQWGNVLDFPICFLWSLSSQVFLKLPSILLGAGVGKLPTSKGVRGTQKCDGWWCNLNMDISSFHCYFLPISVQQTVRKLDLENVWTIWQLWSKLIFIWALLHCLFNRLAQPPRKIAYLNI